MTKKHHHIFTIYTTGEQTITYYNYLKNRLKHVNVTINQAPEQHLIIQLNESITPDDDSLHVSELLIDEIVDAVTDAQKSIENQKTVLMVSDFDRDVILHAFDDIVPIRVLTEHELAKCVTLEGKNTQAKNDLTSAYIHLQAGQVAEAFSYIMQLPQIKPIVPIQSLRRVIRLEPLSDQHPNMYESKIDAARMIRQLAGALTREAQTFTTNHTIDLAYDSSLSCSFDAYRLTIDEIDRVNNQITKQIQATFAEKPSYLFSIADEKNDVFINTLLIDNNALFVLSEKNSLYNQQFLRKLKKDTQVEIGETSFVALEMNRQKQTKGE